MSRRISNLWGKSKKFLENLNFFPSQPPSTDEYEVYTQRITTRLFLLIFVLSLLILLLYNSLITVTTIVNVDTPVFAQYSQLSSTYSQTLTCPCSKISINYGNFLRVKYTLHQVCRSGFIDPSWIDYIPSLSESLYSVLRTDFRITGQSAFETLRTLCSSINTTILDSLTRFYTEQYVSASVVRQDLFESETDSVVNRLRSLVTDNFLSSLSMIRGTTQANALLSAHKTNYIINREMIGYINVWMSPRSYNECSCLSLSTCTARSTIFKSISPESPFIVPGFYVGCYVVDALLQSTLECFFDQTCIDQLQEYLLSSSSILMRMIALNSSLLTRYSIHSTIEELLNSLMIEQWQPSQQYEQYYNQCQPTQCMYTIQKKNDPIYIATTLFGIAGGLTTVFNLILPPLVNFFRKKRTQRRILAEMAMRDTIRHALTKSKHYIKTYNVFPSVPPSTNEYEIRTQRISTRLFILALVSSMTILLLYTSLIKKVKTIDVKTPSFERYSLLNLIYSDTLTCPCSKISINYGKFVRVKYTFHQVCSSIFVNQSWIDYLAEQQEIGLNMIDFRRTSSSAFQALKIFCQLMNSTVTNGLNRFYSDQYVSGSIIQRKLFESEARIVVDKYRLSMTNNILQSLSMTENMTQANALLSTLKPKLTTVTHLDQLEIMLIRSDFYDDCACVSLSTCIAESLIFDPSNSTAPFPVRGFYTGCSVIGSLLRSSLECFFDQTCIDELQVYLSPSPSITMKALNSSLLNPSYSVNSTIKELLDQLMIEQWNVSSDHQQYYNQCQPKQCTYTIQTRNDLIYIATTLFGIAGGLTTVLEFILLRGMKIFRKKSERQQQQQTLTGLNRERRAAFVWQQLKHRVQNLNFFASKPPSTDENILRIERISTRLFIVLMAVSMTILLLYTSLIKITKTVDIKTPSFEHYSHLYSTYPQTLVCPCSKLSTDYKEFLRVEYTIHQVCKSIYVDERWIDYLANYALFMASDLDFRMGFSHKFQVLKAFCALINTTISDGLTQFYSDQYVSASVIHQDLFESEIQSVVYQFRSSMTNNFLLSLSVIQDTTHANALLSTLPTNYYLVSQHDLEEILMYFRHYGNCSCLTSFTCIRPIMTNSYFEASFPIVPGFYEGCYVIESLLQSTLECFFNQTCVDALQNTMTYSRLTNVSALDEAIPSLYSSKATVKVLLHTLMIERWNVSTIYERYYNECQVVQCTYTFQTRNDLIYIATTLFGIAGGLTTIFELILPHFVRFVMYCVRKQRTRVAPDVSIVQTQLTAT